MLQAAKLPMTKQRWAWGLAGLVLAAIGFFEGRKYLADEEVRELCARDGGIKVYETVTLPAEKFDRFGNFKIPLKKDAKSNDEYYYEWDVETYRQGNPETWRNRFILYRAIDQKILGEAIGYSRRGGDFPSPMHESSFGCPFDSDISVLKKQIFISGTARRGK